MGVPVVLFDCVVFMEILFPNVLNKRNVWNFAGVAKHEAFKLYPDEPPNTTDVEESIKKLKDNDANLKELNLNNIKVHPAYYCVLLKNVSVL